MRYIYARWIPYTMQERIMTLAHHGERQTLLLTVEETAAELRIARRRVFELIGAGLLPSVTIGRSRRVRSADLAEYVAKLADDKVPA